MKNIAFVKRFGFYLGFFALVIFFQLKKTSEAIAIVDEINHSTHFENSSNERFSFDFHLLHSLQQSELIDFGVDDEFQGKSKITGVKSGLSKITIPTYFFYLDVFHRQQAIFLQEYHPPYPILFHQLKLDCC